MGNEITKQSNDETNVRLESAHHVCYNLKVIIRGVRGVGKTTLWRRFQGHPFVAKYTPTDSISTANVVWNYKSTVDLIKLELWDVVDKKKKRAPVGLKIVNETESDKEENDEAQIPLPSDRSFKLGAHVVENIDATTLNPLRGCHGVIFLFDITRSETWEYVCKEAVKVPNDIPIFICANFRDQELSRVVSKETIEAFVHTLPHSVFWSETSLKDAFGLRAVNNFINIVFLSLQKRYIQYMIDTNTEELESSKAETILLSEQTYEDYQKSIQLKEKVLKQPETVPFKEEVADEEKEVKFPSPQRHDVPSLLEEVNNKPSPEVPHSAKRHIQLKKRDLQTQQTVSHSTDEKKIETKKIQPQTEKTSKPNPIPKKMDNKNEKQKSTQQKLAPETNNSDLSAEESLRQLKLLASKPSAESQLKSADDFVPDGNEGFQAALQNIAASEAAVTPPITTKITKPEKTTSRNPLLLTELEPEDEDIETEPMQDVTLE